MTAALISPNSAFISGPLTTFASKYENAEFIGDRVVPPILVDAPAATFQKRLRNESINASGKDDLVGARSVINEVSYEIDTDTYRVTSRGLKQPIPRLTVQVSNSALNVREVGVENVMTQIKLRREIRQADLVMTSGNWASGNTGAIANNWNDHVDGAPVTDMKTGLRAIPHNGPGRRVYGVCSDIVWDEISMHPQVMSLRSNGGTDGGPATPEELARYLRIDGILVSAVQKGTAALGLTDTYGRVWGSTTFAFVVVPAQVMSIEQMMFGAVFMQNLDGSQNGVRVREWHDPAQGQGGTDFVAVELSDDEKVIQNDAGYLFTSVL